MLKFAVPLNTTCTLSKPNCISVATAEHTALNYHIQFIKWYSTVILILAVAYVILEI